MKRLVQIMKRAMLVSMCLVLVDSSTIFAFDANFYAQNDIFYYDPSGCEPASDSNVAQGTSGVKYATTQVGNIPLEGEEVGATFYGGPRDAQIQDNAVGNDGKPLKGTVSYAELGTGGQVGNAMGGLPNGTKLEISYKGRSVIAEKRDVGKGGGPVDGKPRKIDLWWETANMIGMNDTAVVKIRAVDPSTPLSTPNGGTPNTPDAPGSPSQNPPQGGTSSTPTDSSSNKNVYVLGDSITAGAKDAITKAIQEKGYSSTVNGVESRSITNAPGGKTGLSAVETDKDAISKAGSVVIALGTNDIANEGEIKQLVDAVKAANSSVKIFWVDVGIIISEESRAAHKTVPDKVNKLIYGQASGQGYTTVSWAKAIDSNMNPPESIANITDKNNYFDGDPINPNSKGSEAFAKLIADAVSSGATPPKEESKGQCTCAAPSAISVSGDDNAEKIYNFLTTTPFKGLDGKPFNHVQASGALGNFYQESGYKFDIVQGGRSEVSPTSAASGVGYGIAQWDADRRVTLNKVAQEMGKSWKDPEVQFKMIANELNGSEGTRLKGFEGGKFMTTTDPKEASYLFMKSYERAGKPAQSKRDNEAQRVYEKYKGKAPDPSAVATGGDTTSAKDCVGTGTAKSDGSKASFVTKDGYAVYLQSDPRWKGNPYSSSTIGKSGCGPSSMTMIITALTGKAMDINEVHKVAADAGMYIPGSGSSWEMGPVVAKHYGLKSRKISKNVSEVNNAVRAGGYVLMSGQGSVPFTRGGHYIHVRGITADGKWMIGDSIHRDANEKPWDPNHILSQARNNLVVISK